MDDNTSASAPNLSAKYSGLSGNEMYCVNLLGYQPGNLLLGNSVFSMGFLGNIGSGIKTFTGGEINQVTNMIAEGRRLSLSRFAQELSDAKGAGASGVTSELIMHPGNIEFLTIGSTIHRNDGDTSYSFTSSADGQELFCQWDAGYQPVGFVFGNVAYSIGAVQGVFGSIKQIAKGEVSQYSNIFNKTRNLALQRITDEAKSMNANSVVGIRTTILPVGTSGVQEMIMIGTASYNPQIDSIASIAGGVTTSDLTAEETWNITQLGYAPIKLLIGTSVYSLGFVGGLKAALKNFVKGEISDLTQLIYGAREQSIKKLQQQAEEVDADDVLGIKTYIYNIGGNLIEFMAIGTAVKRVNNLSSRSKQLPPQAIIRDKSTFFDTANVSYGTDLNDTVI
jgi:uncharacterized protein YbjQ (UPF0145 family)